MTTCRSRPGRYIHHVHVHVHVHVWKLYRDTYMYIPRCSFHYSIINLIHVLLCSMTDVVLVDNEPSARHNQVGTILSILLLPMPYTMYIVCT